MSWVPALSRRPDAAFADPSDTEGQFCDRSRTGFEYQPAMELTRQALQNPLPETVRVRLKIVRQTGSVVRNAQYIDASSAADAYGNQTVVPIAKRVFQGIGHQLGDNQRQGHQGIEA